MNRRFGRLPAMASVILAAVLAAGVVTISRQGAAAPAGKAADRESVANAPRARRPGWPPRPRTVGVRAPAEGQ